MSAIVLVGAGMILLLSHRPGWQGLGVVLVTLAMLVEGRRAPGRIVLVKEVRVVPPEPGERFLRELARLGEELEG